MEFDSSDIISQQVINESLRAFYVGFDFGVYRNDSFTEIVMDTIVDFAYGYHTGISRKYNRRKLQEAANSIYKIKEYADIKWIYVDEDSELLDCELKAEKKYIKRGEFGEMILHLILRDYFHTVPLLSKIFFKDTDGAVVHGFDMVHIGKSIESENDSLYLGESKVYSRKDGRSGKHGVSDLIDDVKNHFKKDFLYREIALISKKKDAYVSIDAYDDKNTVDEYKDFLNNKERWFAKLQDVANKRLKLEDLFESVTIPLICIYQSDVFKGVTDEKSDDFLIELDNEIMELKKHFDEKFNEFDIENGEPTKTKLNVILILFPIPNKKDLIKSLHEKLYKLQG